MRGLHVLIGIGLALAVTFPAAASPQRDYAACVARVRPKVASELLSVWSRSEAERVFQQAANNDYCQKRVFSSGSFRPQDEAMTIGMLRGMFAEQALLLNKNASLPAALPLRAQSYDRPWFAATGRAAAVDEMAACMADTDPASIMGLLRTAPDSWDEQAWMTSLPASLSRCLTAGVHLDANRAALRAALADALYQRDHEKQVSQ
jgi:hypothetical protein